MRRVFKRGYSKKFKQTTMTDSMKVRGKFQLCTCTLLRCLFVFFFLPWACILFFLTMSQELLLAFPYVAELLPHEQIENPANEIHRNLCVNSSKSP